MREKGTIINEKENDKKKSEENEQWSKSERVKKEIIMIKAKENKIKQRKKNPKRQQW